MVASGVIALYFSQYIKGVTALTCLESFSTSCQSTLRSSLTEFNFVQVRMWRKDEDLYTLSSVSHESLLSETLFKTRSYVSGILTFRTSV
ncbi:Hypothetical predicted protein [Octopus vulgaris]|uniref:Uncharacterized protein n=1 Tax=Octopus vulgaris TaxID=6645 RepID=A0AA36AYR3_OCTVU|nr:Hypothetical predicted protein [Octopus vulgaris]